MTVRTFIYNWILTILTTSMVGGLVTSIVMLITENFDVKLLTLPIVFIGMFGLPALILALPYALIMFSAITWNEKLDPKERHPFLIKLHALLCVVYLVGTFLIGLTDGTPWPFMVIVGSFALVGTVFMVKPVDEKPFFHRIKNIKNIF